MLVISDSALLPLSATGGGRKATPTVIQQLSYMQKQSGNNDLHFANCLPDRNFQLSIFNFQFKKTSARA